MNNKPLKQEEIFYNDIKTLIENLLINNKNYRNDYYYDKYRGTFDYSKLLDDIKESSEYILERMEREKHLIGLGEDDE